MKDEHHPNQGKLFLVNFEKRDRREGGGGEETRVNVSGKRKNLFPLRKEGRYEEVFLASALEANDELDYLFTTHLYKRNR